MSRSRIVREILMEIERDPNISQKRLAETIGISVGMVNWHIKRCVNKGFVKLQQAPVKRYMYYLTPEGFVEKVT
ncbi:winged helix-turn-helix transcriptional regulator [Aestuariispira insulae]|uniref:Winged helix-turn-helix DNA-binding protein n=1 Tax=Aestuariispira insulae TaxID=1461337 RepID=A0A3D9H2K1_9PROT|nr:winged helix-turn-helix transcriptional regulator [Aestuariispira insulae]RED43747.1 winged helix-turn-helix DNA-binding protein [Aestuariispira insulae]